jgi:uncharacterized damage-inducible protein DinB
MKRNHAIDAILDIYLGVISSFKETISTIPDSKLTNIIFPESTNACESIQNILSHVVHSGFGYATSIHNSKGNDLIRQEETFHLTVEQYIKDLTEMFNYTEKILLNFTDEELEQHDPSLKITTNWGQLYDIEQLMEHAITHVMRHERQIARIQTSL